MTTQQREAIPAALKSAEDYAEANGLHTNLTTYADVREMANGIGNWAVFLYTTDGGGHEVTVRVEITESGAIWPPIGLDAWVVT